MSWGELRWGEVSWGEVRCVVGKVGILQLMIAAIRRETKKVVLLANEGNLKCKPMASLFFHHFYHLHYFFLSHYYLINLIYSFKYFMSYPLGNQCDNFLSQISQLLIEWNQMSIYRFRSGKYRRWRQREGVRGVIISSLSYHIISSSWYLTYSKRYSSDSCNWTSCIN